MKKAIYAGSFDPVTFGHLNIIERASQIVDELIVLVSFAENKKYFFSSDERANLIKESLCDINIKNVKIESHKGLVVDYAKKQNINLFIRGVRAVSDFEHEMAMAQMNKKLHPPVDTLILFTKPEVSYISSRFVKEIAANHGNLEGLVPHPVESKMKECL